MSPLVEQMIEATHARDLELVELEDWFNEDCRCETDHVETSCSFKVVSVVSSTCDGGTTMKCENGTVHTQRLMSGNLTLCAICDRLASECWTIRPI